MVLDENRWCHVRFKKSIAPFPFLSPFRLVGREVYIFLKIDIPGAIEVLNGIL